MPQRSTIKPASGISGIQKRKSHFVKPTTRGSGTSRRCCKGSLSPLRSAGKRPAISAAAIEVATRRGEGMGASWGKGAFAAGDLASLEPGGHRSWSSHPLIREKRREIFDSARPFVFEFYES